MRKTIQRQMLLEAVAALNHPTASEVYAFIREQYPNISMGTVYRNLNLLAQKGELRILHIPDSPERFDLLTTQHYHMRCKKCGEIINIDTDYLAEIDEKISRATGVRIDHHQIFFLGVCKNCRKDSI
jgi:Fe2+ or Zn2+ uptake regulation protein